MCAVLASYFHPNRTPRRNINTSDNVALSDIMLIIEKWPKSSSKTPKFTSRRPRRCLSARRLGVMFPRRRCRATAPSPLSPVRIRRWPISQAWLTAPGVCRGGEFRQYPQGLRLGLEAFFCLVPAIRPLSPPPASTHRRALHHCLRFGGGRARCKAELRFHNRTSPLVTILELRAARADA